MGALLSGEFGLDDNDNVEQVWKTLTPRGHRIDLGTNAILDDARFEIVLQDILVIETSA